MDKMKIESKYKDEEADALNDPTGNIDQKISKLKAARDRELKKKELMAEQNAKDKELALRAEKEGQFFKEREELILEEAQKKRARIEDIKNENSDDPNVQEISKKILGRIGKSA